MELEKFEKAKKVKEDLIKPIIDLKQQETVKYKIMLIILSCLMLFSCRPHSKFIIKDMNGETYYADEIYNWDKYNCITFWDLDLNGVGKKTKICDCYFISKNKK